MCIRDRPGYQKQQGEVYRQLLQTPAPMQKPKAPEPQEPALAANSQSFGRVLTIVHSDCALLERDGNISLLSLPVAERWLRQAQLTPGEAPVCAQPLLIPLRLKVSAEEKSALEKAQSALCLLYTSRHTNSPRSAVIATDNHQPPVIAFMRSRATRFQPVRKLFC